MADTAANGPGGCPLFLGRIASSVRPDALVLAVPGHPTSFRTRERVIDGLGVPAERPRL